MDEVLTVMLDEHDRQAFDRFDRFVLRTLVLLVGIDGMNLGTLPPAGVRDVPIVVGMCLALVAEAFQARGGPVQTPPNARWTGVKPLPTRLGPV